MISPRFLLALAVATGLGAAELPHRCKQGTATQRIVDGQPFLARGGELGNSPGEPDYLRPLCPELKALSLNPVVTRVYWDVIEPAAGHYESVSPDICFPDFAEWVDRYTGGGDRRLIPEALRSPAAAVNNRPVLGARSGTGFPLRRV